MLVAPQFSQIQKREVTTYSVTSSEKSMMHCTIQQAIDKADAYSRIVIAPGEYYESLTISQPLEIVGEPGGDEKAAIVGRNCCINVVGDVECYFENIRVETKRSQFISTSAILGKGVYAVRLGAGRPTFYRCELTSVFVGGQCKPNISHCTISGNVQGCGLVVAEEAGGLYANNTISNHIPYAVEVSSRGDAVLRENTIFQDPKVWSKIYTEFEQATGGAVRITRTILNDADQLRSVAPRFIQNKIGDEVTGFSSRSSQFDEQVAGEAPGEPFEAATAGCFRYGVSVDAGCSPFFEENLITGGHIGLCLNPLSSGHFTNNIFSHSSKCGVYAGPGSLTTVRFGVITKCATGVIAKSTTAVFAQNSIKENNGSGMLVLVNQTDEFRMTGNSFVGNDTGITIRSGTKQCFRPNAADSTLAVDAILADCFVSLNKVCGVLVFGSGFTVRLEGLTISSNGRYGAFVAHGAAPRFVKTTFERGPIGVLSERRGNPHIVDCQFTGQSDAGVHVVNRGKGSIKGSSFSHFTAVGIHVEDGGNPLITNNTIMSESGTAILVSHGGIGTIRENKIDMVNRGVSITTYGDPLVVDNQFQSCTEMGIHVTEEGLGTIVGNTVVACTVGIGCLLGGECVVRANTVRQCTRFGIVCGEGSRMILEKNMIEKNIVGNVLLEGEDCCPYVAGNCISGSAGFGVRSVRQAAGLVTRNKFSKNGDGAIGTGEGGVTRFVANTCLRECGPGICVRERGRGTFINNTVSDGDGPGIKLCQGSLALVTGGAISRNACGILVDSGCGGEVHHVSICCNTGAGILFAYQSTSNANLHHLTIEDNAGPGIEVNDQATGVIDKCTIKKHKIGVLLTMAGQIQILNCEVEQNELGTSVTKGGAGIIQRCIYRLNDTDIEFVAEGHAVVSQCDLGEGSNTSLLCGAKGKGTVQNCQIRKVVETGIRCVCFNKTLVDSCRIVECEEGMFCEEGSWTTISNNSFSNCSKRNIRLARMAAPTVSNNIIENSESSGVVLEGPGATLIKNIIRGNKTHGVVILGGDAQQAGRRRSLRPKEGTSETSKPTGKVYENSIYGNKGCGVFVDAEGSGDISQNEIFENFEGGVVVMPGASPHVQTNRIHHNVKFGIALHEYSGAIVRENELAYNPCNIDLLPRSSGSVTNNNLSNAGVASVQALETNCAVSKNTFRDNTQGCGLLLLGPNTSMIVSDNTFTKNAIGVSASRPGASCTIKLNVFSYNSVCGLEIENEGAPTVTENIFENGFSALLLKGGAAGSVSRNTFRLNGEGISFAGDVKTQLQENKLMNNQKGIVVRMAEKLLLEMFIFGANEVAAISVEDGRCTIRKNEFKGGLRGISVSGSAAANILVNKFESVQTGVEISGRGVVEMERNAFTACETGCRVSSTGKGIAIVNNSFAYCTVAGLHSERMAAPSVSRCLFASCLEAVSCGLLLTDLGSGCFSECDFHHNSVAVKSHAGCGEVLRSMIHDNNLGFLAETNATTSISECNFFSNFTGDVLCKSGGMPQVSQSFFKCKTASVSVLLGGSGTFSQNVFRDCAPAIILEDATNPVFQHSQIINCPTGIVARRYPSKNACFLKNIVSNCEVGILAASNSFAQFSQNFITGCEVGVSVERRSTSKFMHNTIHKCSKSGFLLRGQPLGHFSFNLVTDCPIGLQANFPVEPAPRGEAVDPQNSGAFVENTFDHNRTNVNLQAGGLVLRKNHCRNGDVGINVAVDARCTLDGNVVYDNVRVGLFLASRGCTITNNQLYMLNEIGAFECSEGLPPLSKDNDILNHCGFKGSALDSLAPARAMDVEVLRSKDNLQTLQQSLFAMHTQELPPFGECGCTAIIGSSDRRNNALSAIAFDGRKGDDQVEEKGGKRQRQRRESKVQAGRAGAARSDFGQQDSVTLSSIGNIEESSADVPAAHPVPTPPSKALPRTNSRVLKTQLK
jgi:parallel beta-helix repeat protein